MKVYETASFSFTFFNIKDKKSSFIELKKLIGGCKWIDAIEDNCQNPSYHTDDSGICHVFFKDDKLSESLIKMADSFFETLISISSVEEIKVMYSKATEKIVINNMDRYGCYQSISVAEMKYGDKVIVYKAKV
ncbi:MAG: hypothetical protein HDS35_10115 [Bacteroides sp.]|nr:hypothetical protein [Bacteroides sp.]